MSPLFSRLVSRPAAVGIAGLGLVGALAGCSTAATGTGSGSTGGDASTSTDASTSAEAYTDGTYTADGSYTSPGGTESITVEVTLADDIITDVTVTPQADGGTAAGFQNQFADGIAAEAVGKDIDELNVSRVAGSSLTSGGFNAAIEAIKADAA